MIKTATILPCLSRDTQTEGEVASGAYNNTRSRRRASKVVCGATPGGSGELLPAASSGRIMRL
jgi:hypothetical protein